MSDLPAVVVKELSKSFKLPHERAGGIKNLLVNFYKRKKGYEQQHVLHGIDFEIKQGEFFGIVGRNGSGKSTLLKLLAGIYAPDHGLVQVNGSLTPFIELGVGFNPELTGRENVFLNGALLGFNRKEVAAMYHDIVEFAELGRFMDQKLKNYSSGMQVRLAFSIAIRAKSDILLLDEVLAVGDAAFQQKCYDYFEKLKRQKKTVIFVSHDMSAITRFCSKAIYLDKGVLTHSGAPSEIADVYVLNNIEDTEVNDNDKDEEQLSANHKVIGNIVSQTADKVTLKVSYTSKDEEEMYVGLAILRDGVSFAEITTDFKKPLTGVGDVYYSLDATILNGGAYYIGIGLFGLKDRKLLAAGKSKNKFAIKGTDRTKGSAIKLADTWKY